MVTLTEVYKKKLNTRIGYGRHTAWTAFNADKAQLDFFKGKKKIGHVILKPEQAHKVGSMIEHYGKNPDRINFGTVTESGDSLSMVGYRSQPGKVMLFLNFQSIRLDKDSWRKLFRLMNRSGAFLGILGGKKRKIDRKSRSK